MRRRGRGRVEGEGEGGGWSAFVVKRGRREDIIEVYDRKIRY